MERWMESVRDAPAYFVFDDDPEGLEEWEREQQRAVQLLSVLLYVIITLRRVDD